MKTLSFLLLCMVCLFCGKKGVGPGSNCDDYTAKYSASVTAYSSSPTQANCLSLKSSLSELVNKCTILTPQVRAQYNAQIDALTCN